MTRGPINDRQGRCEEPAEEGVLRGRLAGWLVYEPHALRPEFQAYDITDADRRQGHTSEPVYFASRAQSGAAS